ncbi:MAG TPA: XdhC family protein [Candidatus Limnocylindrales bacterium]|nr:XdhC family protein [Candidatus Limnocylindrales bacterium]
MRRDEVFEALQKWHADGLGLAMAMLVDAEGSAPRPIGARLLVADDGRMAGSVSGGCVEGAVIEQALDAMRSGRSRLLHYGISDEASWDVGLTCGGEIDVFLEPLDEARLSLFLRVAEAVAAERPVATAAVVRGPDEMLGTHLAVFPDGVAGEWPLGDPGEVLRALRTELSSIRPRVGIASLGGESVFRNVIAPPPRAWIIGADNVALYLVRFVAEAGFHPIVIDPRSSFADAARFPGVEVRVGWPDEAMSATELGPRDYVVVISNDPKIDEPALAAALAGRPAYIGAIGSRHKQEERREHLLAAGVTHDQLATLHAPIGLDLAGNEPPEIALSIAAELVAARRGGTGHPMREVRPVLVAPA